MGEPTRQSALEHVALLVFVCGAVSAFTHSYGTPAWLLLLPCALSPFWKIERVPRALCEGARYASWVFLGGAIVLGLIFMAYPVLSPRTALRLALLAGYGLSFFSALFLLGTSAWPPARTLFPATLGTLVVACFNPARRLYGSVAVAAVAVFVYLALGARKRSLLRLAFSGLGTLLVAWAIIGFLPPAQGRVEQATFGLFSPPTTHYSGLSLQSRLGDLQQLKLSRRVVMRVRTSRPQKLRGRVYTHYDGQGWQARAAVGQPLRPVPADLPLGEWLEDIPGDLFMVRGTHVPQVAGPQAVRSRIVQTVFNEGLLVSPGQTWLVRAPLTTLSMNAFGSLAPPVSSAVEIYGVVNRRSGEVMQAGPASVEVLKECLALPEDTDGRLKELAERLAAGTSSPQERISRTVSFVENECRYSLEVGEFRSRQPVAEFLFEKKRGYCQYFASAAAVLLRLEGVPARYVSGFNVQEGNRLGGHYVVREADAHAWVEAYLAGQGWVEVDPTPQAEYEALHADLRPGWLENAREWLSAELAELFIRVRGGDWLAAPRWLWRQIKRLARVGLLSAVLLLMLIGLALWWRRNARGRRGPPARGEELDAVPAELAELLSRLDRLWARRGFTRPASRAPLEHLEGIPPEKISPALRDAARKVVESFYRVCFGGARLEPEEISELRQAMERATD